jgi:putative ABC transport system substrate-binding protein
VLRRDVIALIGSAAAVAWPLAAQAQQTGKVYRIAIVHPSFPVVDLTETVPIPVFRGCFEELRRLGIVEGENLVAERFSAEGRTERHPDLVREVVRRNPEVILVVGSSLVLALKAATRTIPIVLIGGDPVADGIVPSLARPGGNITGVSVDAGPGISGKRLELLREGIPRASRIGLLGSRVSWEAPYSMYEEARRLGISLLGPPLNTPVQEAEYRRVFIAMAQQSAEALIVDSETDNVANRRLIVELAEKFRLPAIYPFRPFVDIGGLMAYASDVRDLGRHAAVQIDLILRGRKPGEIPIYRSTKFELIINLKTAKMLGLTIPPSLLARADEVIE